MSNNTNIENRIDLWFPTIVSYNNNICLENIKNFKEKIYQICKEKDQNVRPWTNAYLSTTYYNNQSNKLFDQEVFKPLSEIILERSKYFLKCLGHSEKTINKLKFNNMWANIIKTHHYHAYHTHDTAGDGMVSGVYYVSAPKGAVLNFRNPYHKSRVVQKPKYPNDLNLQIVSYDCTPGTLLLWQPNIEHGYDSHDSITDDKISIAFNLELNND